jgi:hypothetical protein
MRFSHVAAIQDIPILIPNLQQTREKVPFIASPIHSYKNVTHATDDKIIRHVARVS